MKKITLIIILFTSFLITGCSNEKQKIKNSQDSKIEVTKNDPKDVAEILSSDSIDKYTNNNYVEEKVETFNKNETLQAILTSYSWASDSFIFTFTDEGSIIAHTFQNRRNNIKTDDYGTFSIDGNILKIHVNTTLHTPNIINDYDYNLVQSTKSTLQFKDTSKNPTSTLNLTCVTKL